MDIKERVNELAKQYQDKEQSQNQVQPINENTTEELNNKLTNTLFDKETSSSDMHTIIEKAGLAQAMDSDKNLKKNKKIQAKRYFVHTKKEGKIEESIDNAEYQRNLTKEQEEYFSNHKEVLNFARMKEAHSLNHMKFVYWVAIIPYTILSILNALAEVCGGIIGLINVFFEAAFGKRVPTGQVDEKGKPIYITERLNFVTRLFIGICVVALLLFLIMALINAFTGFDLIGVVKNYTQKIK